METIYSRKGLWAILGQWPTGILLLLLLGGKTALAQQPNTYNNWYFGYTAGITFNGGSPQALTDGRLATGEGCAAMSDPTGQLQFYTDGSTIWNRNHEVMPGATGLGGSSQSTQSALIVPYQDNTKRFYVFSVSDEKGSTGVQYAIVDMNLEGGLGGLESKNQSLLASATQKITAVKHCNNLNHWIITHESGTNTFQVNLLNDNGLILQSIRSQAGSVYRQSKGYMKPSHDGRKLAVAVSDSSGGGYLEVIDFDNKAGVVSNPVKLETPETAGAYGIEFSPDNQLLYLSTMFSKNIYQLTVDGLKINATLPVQSAATTSPGVGALQVGPDHRIYGAIPGESSLFVINQPNVSGPGCNLTAGAVSLGGRMAMAGLPFIIDALPPLPSSVTISLTNLGGCNQFRLESHLVNLDPNYLIYQWYRDGKLLPGATQPTYQPTQSGTYTLRVREIKCQDIQQDSNPVPVVLVEVNPTVSAMPDSCGTFRLAAHASGGTVQWIGPGISPPRDQLDSITVSGINGSQTYQVRVSKPGDATCFSQKEVTVTFAVPPPYQLNPSKRTVCGDTLVVNATPTANWDRFRWRSPDGSQVSGTTLVARRSGTYRLTALSTATGCASDAVLTVQLNPKPVFALAMHQIDTCLTNNLAGYLELDAGAVPGVAYTWTQNGLSLGTGQTQVARTYGTYTVTVSTPAGCEARDSLRLVSTCPPQMPVIVLPDAFTPNGDGQNETLVIYGTGVEHMDLTIYNRWGEVVYQASAEGAQAQMGWATWDGTYRGQTVVTGTYGYKLNIKSTDFPDRIVRKGTIQVIR